MTSNTTNNANKDEFAQKVNLVQKRVKPYSFPNPEIFSSNALGYRMRVEFRIWHQDNELNYVMFAPDSLRKPLPVKSFPIASKTIQRLMPILLEHIKNNELLRNKLFQVEFLSTSNGDCLITLIYHKLLEPDWLDVATELAKNLDIFIVGRCRGKQLVVGREYVKEYFVISGDKFSYRQYEQTFTQPNYQINQEMITWADKVTRHSYGDLIELYCGIGNFTIPISRNFNNVIATEVSKRSVRAAKENIVENNIKNIDVVRMSASETAEALAGKRNFRRLSLLPKNINEYKLNTLLIDPPRSGLDPDSIKLASKFQNIIYFSCSLNSFTSDIEVLAKTHASKNFAIFDQFPATEHIEIGVVLSKLG
ncbi:MAG: tRNA (uridine(54)-C5)-methyltransferase TrmA [Halieaceae bacterium]|nr:tRNA (uridine(54)-C5)-methyltransferase TrmA [Halieaceae bacterium]